MDSRIDYACTGTSIGTALVAATPRGVCRIAFGDGEAELVSLLARELPFATLRCDRTALAPYCDAVAAYVDGRSDVLALPLDVRGSAFRRRVWDALAVIPRGATRSYADVALAIGMPKATRAVAGACAANPVAVAIPCHRVVASDGGLGGYRWGVARKRALLAREAASAQGVAADSARKRALLAREAVQGFAADTANSAETGIRAIRMSVRSGMPKSHGQSRSMRLV